MANKSYIIALEEHYYDPEVKRHARGLDAVAVPAIVQRLDDLGELRLKEMDEAGIDMQVLSHRCPGFRDLTRGRRAVGASSNPRLNEVVRDHPDRFAALRHCPPPTPRERPTNSNAPSPSSASKEPW